MISPPMDSFSDYESLPGRLAAWSLPSTAWPQPKNFVSRPSVKTLIEHSCPRSTEPPMTLDASILATHERGIKELTEAREQAKAPAVITKLEAELVEAENALKKNRWAKVDDKKAYIERLRREIQEAKGRQIAAVEQLEKLEKRYAPIKGLVEEQEKIVEIYERYMKNRGEYYGPSVSA